MVLYYFGEVGEGIRLRKFPSPVAFWRRDSQCDGGACVGTKSCVEFADEQCGCGGLAKPDAGDSADGSDWDDILGGFAVSGAAEEVSRRNAGEGGRSADVWRGVSDRSQHAAAGEGVADDGELVGREPDW